jgi:hypothetical protein
LLKSSFKDKNYIRTTGKSSNAIFIQPKNIFQNVGTERFLDHPERYVGMFFGQIVERAASYGDVRIKAAKDNVPPVVVETAANPNLMPIGRGLSVFTEPPVIGERKNEGVQGAIVSGIVQIARQPTELLPEFSYRRIYTCFH